MTEAYGSFSKPVVHFTLHCILRFDSNSASFDSASSTHLISTVFEVGVEEVSDAARLEKCCRMLSIEVAVVALVFGCVDVDCYSAWQRNQPRRREETAQDVPSRSESLPMYSFLCFLHIVGAHC